MQQAQHLHPPLEGGEARRRSPQGLRAGRSGTVEDAREALALVARELQAAEQMLTEVVGSDVGAIPQIARYLNGAGGKRLRPAITALGAGAVGAEEHIPALMSAGELIHLGSLLHDDVVDFADMRRGRPAARVLYGNAVTVLSGDFCVARALLLASEASSATAIELARTVAEMSEGEVLQLQRAGRLDLPLEAYLEVIDRKSASLIAWCAASPAMSIGDLDAAAALTEYGRKVGLAYQIIDDVLDYASGTGKTPGVDLVERKLTLPLLLALERLDGLRDELEEAAPSDARLPSLIAEIEASGALVEARQVALSYVDDALAALARLPDTPHRRALELLAGFLVERSS